MKTDLLIIPSVTDTFEDFKTALKAGIKSPWKVEEEVHTPFSLEEGEQLVIAVTKFVPGFHIAQITYTVLPLATIDQMRTSTPIALTDGVPAEPVTPASPEPAVKITLTPETTLYEGEPAETSEQVADSTPVAE